MSRAAACRHAALGLGAGLGALLLAGIFLMYRDPALALALADLGLC